MEPPTHIMNIWSKPGLLAVVSVSKLNLVMVGASNDLRFETHDNTASKRKIIDLLAILKTNVDRRIFHYNL